MPEVLDWLSFHLYYYEGLLRPIQELVRPVVVDLLLSGKIDRFFFVRYGLGGPHLRFRLRPLAGEREEVHAYVERRALEFLALAPSRSSLSREAIETSTRSLLQLDPLETDGTIYPDNLFQLRPFQPETNRYGGPEFLDASLDFFAVSSSEALVFLQRHAAASRSRQLAWIFRLLLRQAIGFASNLDEFDRILRYAEISWAERFPSIIEKADATFAKQKDIFVLLFQEEMRACDVLTEPSPYTVLLEAARLLGHATKGLGPDRRWVVGGSQLHMTANRLVLSNPEEVYLSRLLSLSWRYLQTVEPPGLPLVRTYHDQLAPDDSEATTRWIKMKFTEMIQ